MMLLFILVIFALYLLFLLLIIFGWNRASKSKEDSGKNFTGLSILIPLRNEADNLLNLFESLNQQNANRKLFEVIFINDHSQDQSEEIYQQHIQSLKFNHRWINLSQNSNGKKPALALGIELAEYPVILTTDADVIHSTAWIGSYQSVFSDNNIQFAFGQVIVKPGKNIFSTIQHHEFCTLMTTAAASLFYGVPTMCNAANMAFRKLAYYKVGGYQSHAHLPSGDDELLYHAIYRCYPKGVKFVSKNEAAVRVDAKADLKSFLSQRVRWASKWKYHDIFPMKFLAIFILLFQLCWLSLPFALYLLPHDRQMLIIFAGAKILLEAVLINSAAKKSGYGFSVIAFVFLQLLYAPYVIISGTLATFSNYSWKGRYFQAKIN